MLKRLAFGIAAGLWLGGAYAPALAADAAAAAAAAGEATAGTGAAVSFSTQAQSGARPAAAPNQRGASVTANTAPTVLLVHGAFADSAGWGGVIARLRAAGVRVWAVSNPLRGIASDSAYVASAFRQTPGPVLAVGHSYGGAIITNAAASAPNVVGLVFVAGFAPDEGETLAGIEGDSRDSVLSTALVQTQYPTGRGSETATELSIDPAKFHDAFAADLPPGDTALMAATQRPIAASGFEERSGPAAWKRLPSWAVIPTGDKAAGTDVLRTMAVRAKARITEIEGSHVIMISQPQAVADAILKALQDLRAPGRAGAEAPASMAAAE